MAHSTLSSSDFSLCLFKASEMPIFPWDQQAYNPAGQTLPTTFSRLTFEVVAPRVTVA